ncbi:hypothetical protein EAL2_c05000 [Peptoclostridium acidaminophilum DSM 3953]|uniref:Uncharacterized protein n=1 Tax=Peptoclostridium acidaminophilum DSM 3953 TaxID=1286171 RepID=W8THZ2_PEPAC|nr:hypothetical protein EAL2_c05000 [Peptoclostridium acidaminophilum DSM 3953]
MNDSFTTPKTLKTEEIKSSARGNAIDIPMIEITKFNNELIFGSLL